MGNKNLSLRLAMAANRGSMADVAALPYLRDHDKFPTCAPRMDWFVPIISNCTPNPIFRAVAPI